MGDITVFKHKIGIIEKELLKESVQKDEVLKNQYLHYLGILNEICSKNVA